jgi:hypothetical protein
MKQSLLFFARMNESFLLRQNSRGIATKWNEIRISRFPPLSFASIFYNFLLHLQPLQDLSIYFSDPIIIGTMPATSQKFKLGSSERELDLVPSRVPHERPFIYVDDVLEAFKIPHADRFEAEGRTVAYVRNDNGIM